MQVTVNAESYRDDWQLPPREDGTIRVLLVGDSNVFGHGIPDKSGTLDVFLEKALNAAGAARWDVWNVANHPAALWYSTEAIRRIAPDAHPRYAVLYVDDTDLTFVDEQRALADQPGWFYSLERHVGLYDDLLWMWHHTGWPAEKVQRNSAVVAAGREAFERLLAFADAQGVGLVVWEAVGPLRFFDPYRGRPGLAFVDWRNAIGARCPAQRGVCTWRDDPTFAYPDGHPLPATNGRIAGAVARALMELERSPRREDVHHLDRGE